MAEIKPFSGLIYNKDKVDISSVVCPPYDVIDSQERDAFYNLSKHNVIRLILNRSTNPYKQARKFLETWRKQAILVKEHKNVFYLYIQRFNYNKKKYTRYGFIGLLKIEQPSSKILFHERTYDEPKQDRFNLLLEVKANLCPIFVVFSDRANKAQKVLKMAENNQHLFKFDFNEVNHTLSRIEDSDIIEELKKIVSKKQILIADGHHRYEVALRYKELMKKSCARNLEMPYDYIMSYFAPIEQEGLLVLPTHRLINLKTSYEDFVNRLRDYFEIFRCPKREELFKRLKDERDCCFGVYFHNRFYILKTRTQPLTSLNVILLHELVFEKIFNYRGKITYSQDIEEAIELVNKKKYDTAFFLNPIPVKEILRLTRKNLLLPEKSTYFYPKVLTGLVFYKF